MDNKKFTIMVAVLTVFICIITVIYNFASFPAYSDDEALAIPIYKDRELSVLDSSSSTNNNYVSESSEEVASSQISSDQQTENSSTSRESTASNTISSSGASSTQSTQTSSSSKTSSSSSKASTSSELGLASVNINTATQAELEEVPYIGEVKAKAIIDYRTTNGNFKSIDELDNVKGFGSATIEKIRKYLTV